MTNTVAVLRVLVRELTNHSFEITDNNLVVHSPEQPFALPLQTKFAWLNDDLSVKVLRDDIALDAAIALFLADMSRAAVSPAVLLDRPLSPATAPSVPPENTLRDRDEDIALVESLPATEYLNTADQQAPADALLEAEPPNIHGTQLQLFSIPPIQQTKEDQVPLRRGRRQRPRSDPRSPRAEPPMNKLFSVITTDSISSSVQGKEVNQKD